jgi:hypothetical protein
VFDWPTIASLATAGGTLVLAIATFSSVRSSNRSARAAERSLQAGIRPLLLPSRPQDPPEKVMWVDRHFARLAGGEGSIEEVEGVFYAAVAVRNVGAGIAVQHGWCVAAGRPDPALPHPEPDAFRILGRDLYIAPGDTGFWQGAVRSYDDPYREVFMRTMADREALTVDLLYGDHEGGQRTITRFVLTPIHEDRWLCTAARHWNLDRSDPR